MELWNINITENETSEENNISFPIRALSLVPSSHRLEQDKSILGLWKMRQVHRPCSEKLFNLLWGTFSETFFDNTYCLCCCVIPKKCIFIGRSIRFNKKKINYYINLTQVALRNVISFRAYAIFEDAVWGALWRREKS